MSKYITLKERIEEMNLLKEEVVSSRIDEMSLHYIADENVFKFDFESDLEGGVIELCKPELYTNNFDKYVYKFGYKFNAVDKPVQKKFINQLKQITNRSWSDKENYNFLTKPLLLLDKEVGFSKFDTLIYPISNRSTLVQEIVKYIGRFIPNQKPFFTFELFKNETENVRFDKKRYYNDNKEKFGNEKTWSQAEKSIDDLMIQINNGDYFRIGTQKQKYKPYFYDYLLFTDDDMNKFCKIENRKILLIDDINTTGSTIDEMLSYINSLNDTNEIFIFTIIGKEQN